MKPLRIVWGVLLNLIALVVILGVLASHNAQPLVLVGLVMIYLSVVSGLQGQSYFAHLRAVRAEERHIELIRLIRPPKRVQLTDEETDWDAARVEEAQTGLDELKHPNWMPRFWIDMAFYTVEWVIALFFLFSAL